jgi:hypothetical protein
MTKRRKERFLVGKKSKKKNEKKWTCWSDPWQSTPNGITPYPYWVERILPCHEVDIHHHHHHKIYIYNF